MTTSREKNSYSSEVRKLQIAGGIIIALAILLGATFFHYFGPGGSGIIGNLTLEDGTEIKIIQSYNNSFGEPYTIDFYIKRPGEPWGSCYIEHEDTRWSGARLVLDPEKHSIKIYRGSTLRAEYFTERKTFALYADGQTERPAPYNDRAPPL